VDGGLAESRLRTTIERAIRESRGADTFSVTDPRALRLEATTSGIDEFLQGIGNDPFRSLSADGLRVPGLVNTPSTRYLFQAVTISVANGERIRLLGRRQMMRLGVVQPGGTDPETPPRLIELDVVSPSFRLPDGNVSWHLMRVPPRQGLTTVRPWTDSTNFIFRRAATGSALVYETATFPAGSVNPFGRPDFYVSMTGYTPPNSGWPYGTPLLPTWHGVRNPWSDPYSADWTGLEINGPCDIIDYISVLQTSGGGNPQIVQPSNPHDLDLLGTPEERFLAAYPGAVQIWRVGSAIQYEVL
jgi:hypothetical protein